MKSANLNTLTITEAAAGLRAKEFSSVELTQACLARAKERNARLNAFITIDEIKALEQAKIADTLLASDNSFPLTGIPYSIKDAICTAGTLSTGASKILGDYIPIYDATVIKKIRATGAVLIGKTNCDTFGHGASNENSMYGSVRNPYDETKVSGGSSGGSAVSVADNHCLFSIGEDTGGSIRQPASFCGINGLRPTYGRNSRYGIMAMASSLDVVGPMTKTVADMAIIMETMAGYDPLDATPVTEAVPNYTQEIIGSITGLKIGVPKEYFELEGMDEETKKIVEEKIKELEKLGAQLIPVSLPYTKYAVPTYYLIVPSEDSSNLARLDGLRYGVRVPGEDLYATYANTRAAGFPDEVKRRIMIGTYALSAGYYDAYYKKAQKVRTLIIQDFQTAFSRCDAIVTPTSPFPAFDIGAKKEDILAMYLADVFVSPASVAGLPALSIPAGKTEAGLPVGLQIIGPRLADALVMRIGNHLEKIK